MRTKRTLCLFSQMKNTLILRWSVFTNPIPVALRRYCSSLWFIAETSKHDFFTTIGNCARKELGSDYILKLLSNLWLNWWWKTSFWKTKTRLLSFRAFDDISFLARDPTLKKCGTLSSQCFISHLYFEATAKSQHVNRSEWHNSCTCNESPLEISGEERQDCGRTWDTQSGRRRVEEAGKQTTQSEPIEKFARLVRGASLQLYDAFCFRTFTYCKYASRSTQNLTPASQIL